MFRVNPDYDEPGPDLKLADDPSGSLAAPTNPPDMSTTAPPSGPDMFSPCTRVTEPFTADPSARWTLMGDTAFDAAGGLQLTSLGFNLAGSAFFDSAMPATGFDATFNFRNAEGSGADGLAFVIAEAASPAALTPFGDGVVNQGYGLGYLGMDGFAVEFDTFLDIGNGDPNGNHVGFVRTSDGTHLLTGTPSGSLHSAGVHTAHIRFTGSHVSVEVDGAMIVDGNLPAGVGPSPTAPAFFGFTAASSSFTDRHTVSNLTLIVGPAGTCF